MGEARRRGTFEQRKAAAIAAGRTKASTSTAKPSEAGSSASPPHRLKLMIGALAPLLLATLRDRR
jgi:hypothetical protein